MHTKQSQVISRHQYQPYPYHLDSVDLQFDLAADATQVIAALTFSSKNTTKQNGNGQLPALVLDGDALELVSLSMDNQRLSTADYTLSDTTLTLYPTAPNFTLEIITQCKPADNTQLMGLYQSGQQLMTQCEAQGFRRITWFPDRPDVMSVYTVTLRADAKEYPVLLSNGNLRSETSLPDGRHQTVWHDPHPKPSYLFALVAGTFDVNEKTVRTANGRNVLLQLYSDPGNNDKTAWAMACLERALKWDEERFGLALDLDRFMVVAARDFNMGAMENKGLNIFNASYVLATPDTATDHTYRIIEAVIGHEYFHNWTGNRVTCRDWFQLSLKEGLTVFREQEFAADMLAQDLPDDAANSARAVKRIDDVDLLRTQQFPEDAGPMAHPIRPDSYQEISNFYTATIYEKGAEVIRMLHTLLGERGFVEGLREYFHRHDGQAVTCDDFLDAMEFVYRQKKPSRDLAAFRRWYEQAGTPRVHIQMDHNANTRQVTLTLSQDNPPVGLEREQTPLPEKPPLHIPIAIGFLNRPDATHILELREKTQTWTFDEHAEKPVLSVLRGFSAPVILHYDREPKEHILLATQDTDPFSRWQAVQDIVTQEIINQQQQQDATLGKAITEVWQSLLRDQTLAPDYQARILTLTSESQLLHHVQPMDPQATSTSHQHVLSRLGHYFASDWLQLIELHKDVLQAPYRPTAIAAGKRKLIATALNYLIAAKHPQGIELAQSQVRHANNLTDRLNGLQALTRYATPEASADLLEDFYHHAHADAALMDHWFSLQAKAGWANTETIRTLMAHPDFSERNPNRFRAVVFQFCLNNMAAIHQPEGYTFWAEQVIAIDRLNPEIAARLARGLDHWAKFAQPYQHGMQTALQTINDSPKLSANVKEVVGRALSTDWSTS